MATTSRADTSLPFIRPRRSVTGDLDADRHRALSIDAANSPLATVDGVVLSLIDGRTPSAAW